ncbi:MAG: extracellular solute-binding protein [Calditrichaeota bacterium]|nr:MAG: extracellular solute-binding protein [Calditrichota bacterium]
MLFPVKKILPFITYLLFLSACQQDSADKNILTFWAMGAEGEKIKHLVPEFEKQHPEIKLKIQSIPWGAAHEKLLTAVAGNTLPDVCQLGNTWIPEFQAIGALAGLDSLVQNSVNLKQEMFFEGIWQTNVIGNQLYGIPWYVDTRVFFYRRDILQAAGYEKPPQTWAEWLDASRKICQNLPPGAKKYAAYFSLISNDGYVPVMLIMANDGLFLKDNYQFAAFDDPRTREALEFYLTFFEENLASRSMTEFTNIYQGFAQGDFSAMIHGSWIGNEIRSRFPELQDKWATAPMPRKKYRTSLAGGASLVIFKGTGKSEAAWKWIEFLGNKETQLDFFHLTSDLPSVRAAWQEPELRDDVISRAFYEQLNDVKGTPEIAEWEQIYVKLQEHLELVIHKKMTLDQMILKLNSEVDQILEKRRWLLARKLLQTN